MIVDMRTYTLFPGLLNDYVEHYGAKGLPIQKRYLGERMLGYFVTEVGPLNQVIHFWQYESMAEREALRAKMVVDPEWAAYLA
ncbi:MAG: NIPSNAP family protein, partial [Alphaproteobacteria bacterium]|nr:NIPSNAP family protein [Alphaproteobacteria bacterium]